MKPLIRLGTCDMWGGYDEKTWGFIDLLRTRVDIELCDKPDFLIYSVFGDQHYRHNCVRILYSGENRRPNWNECDYAFTFDHTNHPDHFRWPLYGQYDDCSKLVKGKQDVEEILRSKTKFCNFIFSNRKCPLRNRFFDLLSKYKQVDAGGKVRNNLGFCVQNKRSFIADYKFTIAFENSSHPGYTTEKLSEPMWENSLPIYWGNPLVHLDFNTKSFLNFADYGSLEALVERVIEVDQNDELYLEYLRQPWFNENRVPECVKLENVLDQFERIFTTPRVPVAVRKPRYRTWKSRWRSLTKWRPWQNSGSSTSRKAA